MQGVQELPAVGDVWGEETGDQVHHVQGGEKGEVCGVEIREGEE